MKSCRLMIGKNMNDKQEIIIQPDLKSMYREELEAWVKEKGQPAFRA